MVNLQFAVSVLEEMKKFSYETERPYETLLKNRSPGAFKKEIDDVIDLLKTREPLPPNHIHEEYPEHVWRRNEDGEIDEMAAESDYHNGPICDRCGETFCVHCEPNGYEKYRICIIDENRCPNCGKILFRPFEKVRKISYCEKCGQAVKWDVI